MNISITVGISFISIVLIGLSAGFFYAWEVSVIPGNKQVDDSTYLTVMQQINRAILNPAFFMVFFGSLFSLALATYLNVGNSTAWKWFLAATLLYLIGTFAVTALGNVPLNNWLDAQSLSDLSLPDLKAIRQRYETRWNILHTWRTVFSVLSFITALWAGFQLISQHISKSI